MATGITPSCPAAPPHFEGRAGSNYQCAVFVLVLLVPGLLSLVLFAVESTSVCLVYCPYTHTPGMHIRFRFGLRFRLCEPGTWLVARPQSAVVKVSPRRPVSWCGCRTQKQNQEAGSRATKDRFNPRFSHFLNDVTRAQSPLLLGSDVASGCAVGKLQYRWLSNRHNIASPI